MVHNNIQKIGFLYLIILLHTHIVITDFSPDTSNFDAYGLKIAVNDIQFVQAYGDVQSFFVQYAPYDYINTSLQCEFDYDDDQRYVYSVGVGIKQNTTLNPYFYFSGEDLSEDSSGNNGTFIGIWINWDSTTVQQYISMGQDVSCDNFSVEYLQFLTAYQHQEFFVVAVEPYGNYAIGLATDFTFIYHPFATTPMVVIPITAVWPNNTTFNPYAADASTTFTIVAGFVKGALGSRVRATPTVFVLSNTNLAILSTWSYTAPSNSWQSRLTYSGIDSWSQKYTMSVKINSNDPSRALVGMPFLNTAFLFAISNNGATITLASSINNGQSVGFGKSVAWLTTVQAAILVSTYSSDYSTWVSSNIYLYTSLSNTILPLSPSAIIPNVQQPIPSTINNILIQIVSTPESLAVLDTDGGVIIILAQSPGYYASTDTTNSPFPASMPVVSYPSICIAGTYKSDTGVHPCVLCPSGSRNPGGNASTSCMNCSSTSFCPLGAVYEVDSSALAPISQAYAYPRTPELAVFDDILIFNMFSMGTTGHCLLVSPIFWVLILLLIMVLVLVGMASLNFCVQPPKRDQWRTKIKNVFIKTDLVGEGELWLGGLASIALILLIAMSYAFAISFLNQYPAEEVGPSNFACDVTMRNAQYDTSLQALAVPISDEEQKIFNFLNDQNFTLQLAFVNTAFTCDQLSISQVTESSTTSLNLLSCSNVNGTLSTSVSLSDHDIKIEATLSGSQVVGGVRLGLSGSGFEDDINTLKELSFSQSFYSSWPGTLASSPTITMMITKVINETEPLSGDDSKFGGIWYPTFTYSLNQMFLTATGYVTAGTVQSITLTINIDETSYYIKNVESPIAKLSEVIFRTLLFTILCLELAGLAFLIIKLVLVPLYKKIVRVLCPNNAVEPEEHEGHHHD